MHRARLGAAILLTVVGAGTARGQAGWTTTPQILTARPDGSVTTELAVGANGNALHLWTASSSAGLDLRVTVFHAVEGSWTAPTTLAQGASLLVGPAAFDPAGNAVVLFSREDPPAGRYLYAIRYGGADRQWSTATRLSDFVFPGAIPAALAIGFPSSGGAVVVFTSGAAPQVRRTTTATSDWLPAQTLFAAAPAQVAAVEPSGGVVLAGADLQGVRAVSCSVDGSCGPPVVVHAVSTGLAPLLTLAANRSGDLVLAWEHGTVAAAIRSRLGLWSPATTLSSPGASNATARVGIDEAGGAVVAWQRFDAPGAAAWSVQARRFDPDDDLWGPLQTLSTSAIGTPAVAVDPAGNAFVAWRQRTAAVIAEAAVRFRADLEQWGVVHVLPTLGDTADDPAAGADAAGNALVAWRAAGGGSGATLAARWRATPAAPLVSAATVAPGTLHLAVSLPPAAELGLLPTGYEVSVDDGATWSPHPLPAPASPITVANLVDGVTYAARVRAVNAAGTGDASDSLPVRTGSSSEPTGFRVVARTGNTVTFAWAAPRAGVVPDGYLMEGGISGQAQVLASLPTGGAATQFTLTLPDGTFDVRVVAVRGAWRLGQSATSTISVNRLAFPTSPTNLLASAAGNALALSWTNTWSGAALRGLRLFVSGATAASIDLPITETFAYAGVPPGTYTFRVAALGAGGEGGTTDPVTLTFPGTCAGPPDPPTTFSVSSQGGRVFVDWLPPAGGPAATSYVLAVTGAFNGAFPMTSRSLAVPVGPGSYTVRVAAVGPCGTSAFTEAQTVAVP
jgi:hypothetical protein